MFLFLVVALLLLSLPVNSLRRDCIHPEPYWISLASEKWPSNFRDREICGESWYSSMTHASDEPWFIIFRSLCTGSLNSYEERTGLSLTPLLQSLVQNCHDKNRWHDSLVILKNIKLYAFNAGLSNWTLCPLSPPPTPIVTDDTVLPTQIHERIAGYSCEERDDMILFYERASLFIHILILLLIMIMMKKIHQNHPLNRLS